jgi:hypothetical protein
MGKRHLAYLLTWIELSPTSLAVVPFPRPPGYIKFLKERVLMATNSQGVGLFWYRCLLEIRVSVGLSGHHSHAADASVVPPALASGSRLS